MNILFTRVFPLFLSFFHCPVVNPRSNFWRVIVMHIHFKRLFWRIPTSPPPPAQHSALNALNAFPMLTCSFPRRFSQCWLGKMPEILEWQLRFISVFFLLLFFACKANQMRGGREWGRNNKHRQHSINGASSSADCATCGKRSTAGPPSVLPRPPTDYYNDIFAHWLRLIDKYNSAGVAPPPKFRNSRGIAESLISVFV